MRIIEQKPVCVKICFKAFTIDADVRSVSPIAWTYDDNASTAYKM